MLAFAAQFGVGAHPAHLNLINLLEPLGALVIAACTGAIALAVLGPSVPRARRALRSRIARRRRIRAAADIELRARAMMDELCPHGWRAQITLFRASEEAMADAPGGRRDRVALDWTAFENESSRTPVVRRVRAQTITEALDAMVADRRTDETLQHVEQDALADGIVWPEP